MVLGAGEPVTESDAGNHCQGSCIVAVEHAIPPRDVPVGSCGRPAFGIPVHPGKDDRCGGGHRGAGRAGRAGGRARYRQGDTGGVRAGAAGVQAGQAPPGGAYLRHHDQVAAGAGGLASRPGRDPGGDGVDVHLLEAAVLFAGGVVCVLAGERPRGQERAGTAKDGQAGRRLAGQAGRAGQAAAKLGAAAVAARVAGPHPLPAHPYP